VFSADGAFLAIGPAPCRDPALVGLLGASLAALAKRGCVRTGGAEIGLPGNAACLVGLTAGWGITVAFASCCGLTRTNCFATGCPLLNTFCGTAVVATVLYLKFTLRMFVTFVMLVIFVTFRILVTLITFR
jgi:hypothetical protein